MVTGMKQGTRLAREMCRADDISTNNSTEATMLEKRLIFDHSAMSMKKNICNSTDLKSCCDRKLLKLGISVEESTGRNRDAMTLLTKMMPVWKRRACTGRSISKNWRGWTGDKI